LLYVLHDKKVRLAANDGTTDLTGRWEPVDNVLYNVLDQCVAPVVGITHTSSTPKQVGEAIFSTDGILGDITMDVTIVSVSFNLRIDVTVFRPPM
jgi:hypothetical protein